jgi:hypothetical protein
LLYSAAYCFLWCPTCFTWLCLPAPPERRPRAAAALCFRSIEEDEEQRGGLIGTLREVSRQEYLRKREDKKIQVPDVTSLVSVSLAQYPSYCQQRGARTRMSMCPGAQFSQCFVLLAQHHL